MEKGREKTLEEIARLTCSWEITASGEEEK